MTATTALGRVGERVVRQIHGRFHTRREKTNSAAKPNGMAYDIDG